jgi:hypothetical protein
VIVMLLLKQEIVAMLQDNGDLVTAQQAEAKLLMRLTQTRMGNCCERRVSTSSTC